MFALTLYWLWTTGPAIVIMPSHARTLIVAPENRTFIVAPEDRTL